MFQKRKKAVRFLSDLKYVLYTHIKQSYTLFVGYFLLWTLDIKRAKKQISLIKLPAFSLLVIFGFYLLLYYVIKHSVYIKH